MFGFRNIGTAALGFVLLLAPSTLLASMLEPVPSFARRYQLSCSVCHTVFPALNEYGRLFRAKGYRLPGADVPRGERPLGLAPRERAPGSKKSVEIPFIDIPATSVASFQVLADFRYHPDAEIKNEFTGITGVGLLVGGEMGDHFSFFGNVAIIEEGHFEGIDRLFLQYSQSLALNIRVGQFEPRAIPFSNHRRLLRVTPYLGGVFPIVPAQNFWGFSPNQKGVETFGRLTAPGGIGEFEYAVGLVNGGPGGAFEALEGTEGPAGELVHELEEAYEEFGGEFDFNNQKDYYARLNYLMWLRGPLSVGGFAYRGTTGFLADTEDPESFVRDGNDFTRWGFDLRWEQENGYLTALGSVQFYDDDLERALLNNPSAMVTMGEVQAYVLPWLVPGFRFERVDVDDYPAGFPSSFEKFSADLLMLLGSNTMLMFGTTWSSDSAPELPLFEQLVRATFHLAF